ncbi:septum formation family protein [soil metagenome]
MTKLTHESWTRVLTIVTLGAASVALAGCSLLGGGKTATPTDDATTGDDVFSITVGDCLNDASVSGQISTVPIVDCSGPHDSEAYFSGNLDGTDYPGEDAVKQGAEGVCGPAFATFVGAPYKEGSGYDYSYYTPTKESWAAGDREIMCVVFDPSGAQVTGTLKGSEG